MRKFSIGVFLDVLTNNQDEWEDNLGFVEGLKGVEHLELLMEYIPKRREEINFFRKLSKRYKLIVHAPSMDLTLLSPHKEIVSASIRKLREAYDFSSSIGACVLTIHTGGMPRFYSKKEVIKMLKKGISDLGKPVGLPVCIENMPEKWSYQISYPATLEHFLKVAKFSNLTLDIGHFLKSGKDPLLVLRKLSKQILVIHLHDGLKGRDHLALGEGRLDIDEFFKTLRVIDYRGFVSMEVVGRKEITKSWKKIQRFLI